MKTTITKAASVITSSLLAADGEGGGGGGGDVVEDDEHGEDDDGDECTIRRTTAAAAAAATVGNNNYDDGRGGGGGGHVGGLGTTTCGDLLLLGGRGVGGVGGSPGTSSSSSSSLEEEEEETPLFSAVIPFFDFGGRWCDSAAIDVDVDVDDIVHRYHHNYDWHNDDDDDFGGYYCGDDDFCSTTYRKSCCRLTQGLCLSLLRGGGWGDVGSGSDHDSLDGQQQQGHQEEEGHKRGDSNIGAAISAGETTPPTADDDAEAEAATTDGAARSTTMDNTSVDLSSAASSAAAAAAASSSSPFPPQQDLQQPPLTKTPPPSLSQQLQVVQSPPLQQQQRQQLEQQHSQPETTTRRSSASSSSQRRRRRKYFQQQQQQQYSFLATRVVGGSALVDKQTGRVFWEEDSGSASSAGTTTTLWENLAQKRGLDKIEHLSSVILTTILSLVVLNLVFQTIRQSNFMISLLEKLKTSVPDTTTTTTTSAGGGGTSLSLKSIRSIISYAVLKFFVGLFLILGWVLQNIPLVSSVVVMTPRRIVVDTLQHQHQHQHPHPNIIQLTTSRPSVLLFIIIGLYFLEAYTCQTRQYLSNTFFCSSSSNGGGGEEELLQSYIEQLKDTRPVVTWTVTKFHYETRRFIKVPIQVVQSIVGSIRKTTMQTLSQQPRPVNAGLTTSDYGGVGSVGIRDGGSDSSETSGSSTTTTTSTDDGTSNHQQYSPPILYPFLTKRVVSRKATAHYDFGACHDYSTIGVWEFPRENKPSTKAKSTNNSGNRNEELHTTASSNNSSSSGHPAWTKFVLTKLLVLSNERARKDYFQQQSDFVDRVTNQRGPKGSSSSTDTNNSSNNSNDGDYIQFSTRIDIPGYRPRVLLVENHKRPRKSSAYQDDGTGNSSSRQMIDDILSQQQQQQQQRDPKDHTIAPYRAGLVQFWIWTLFGMTLPYRIWFKRHCEVVRVSLIKETMMQTKPSIFSSRSKIQSQEGYWGSSYYQSWKNWITGERSTGDN